MWGIFHIILSVPQIVVMVMNDVMCVASHVEWLKETSI